MFKSKTFLLSPSELGVLLSLKHTKELGDAVGLTANRITQYEMGYRVLKAALLEKMAEVFRIFRLALLELDAGYLSDVMETLFWMNKEVSGMSRLATIQFDNPDCWRDHFQEEEEIVEPCLHGNLTIPCSTFPPPYSGRKTVCWIISSRNGKKSKQLIIPLHFPKQIC